MGWESEEEDLEVQEVSRAEKSFKRRDNNDGAELTVFFRGNRVMTLLFSSLVGSTFLAGLIATPAILVTFFWEKPHPSPYRSYVSVSRALRSSPSVASSQSRLNQTFALIFP